MSQLVRSFVRALVPPTNGLRGWAVASMLVDFCRSLQFAKHRAHSLHIRMQSLSVVVVVLQYPFWRNLARMCRLRISNQPRVGYVGTWSVQCWAQTIPTAKNGAEMKRMASVEHRWMQFEALCLHVCGSTTTKVLLLPPLTNISTYISVCTYVYLLCLLACMCMCGISFNYLSETKSILWPPPTSAKVLHTHIHTYKLF